MAVPSGAVWFSNLKSFWKDKCPSPKSEPLEKWCTEDSPSENNINSTEISEPAPKRLHMEDEFADIPHTSTGPVANSHVSQKKTFDFDKLWIRNIMEVSFTQVNERFNEVEQNLEQTMVQLSSLRDDFEARLTEYDKKLAWYEGSMKAAHLQFFKLEKQVKKCVQTTSVALSKAKNGPSVVENPTGDQSGEVNNKIIDLDSRITVQVQKLRLFLKIRLWHLFCLFLCSIHRGFQCPKLLMPLA